jgi:EAL domain-containing protein (putative c-di-GMP-specific phosphodiesterase class I)/GGDEF domain-containing protein
MATSFRLTSVSLPPADEHASAERFPRTLVELTRTVWHAGCTFDSALAAICEAAADALGVERVTAWRHDAAAGELRGLCAYDRGGRATTIQDGDATLPLADYAEALADVRTFEVVESESTDSGAEPPRGLYAYVQGHGIRALLYAPAYLDGELIGVLCHESVGRGRRWTREEIAFAGSMGDYMAMAHEIARRRRAEAEIEHLRLHDADTGLGNRDYFVELLHQRLTSPRHAGEVLAVVHLVVNTSGGVAWPAGAPTTDEVMARIAERLRELCTEHIELARVRANGFAFVLASGSRQRSVISLAERALAQLRDMAWSHPEIDPTAWAGIAFAEPDESRDPRVFLREAEEAAERARGGDKFGYEVFDPAHHETLVQALQFERALREAFADGNFEVHYQPEFDAQLEHWVAAESLLRWRDGERLVVAGEFIGVVESSGLMLPVGRWVLQQACRDATDWPLLPDGTPAAVRVNVSARQFDAEGLVEDVTAALSDSGLDPRRLCLELTESTLMRDIDHALAVLQRLKSVGVQVAIDDFGTGYASLVYLRRLPVDVLKIDRSFVAGIPGAVTDSAIVRAVVGLADSLGIDVIAEGVENLAQQAALQNLGVRRMQGWLYGKAMDQASLCRQLARSTTGAPAPVLLPLPHSPV